MYSVVVVRLLRQLCVPYLPSHLWRRYLISDRDISFSFRCKFSQWRQPMKQLLSSTYFNTPSAGRYLNNNSASICKVHRTTYERTYPTVVVLPDGSSIKLQYHEPRKIIKNKGMKFLRHLRPGSEVARSIVAASPNGPRSLLRTERAPTMAGKCGCPATRGFFSRNAKHRIVMCRHGESEWNQKNLFCGWYDANLSPTGEAEAVAAGKSVKDACLTFDIAFTSLLTRAQCTLKAILKEIGQEDLETVKTWRLNERHYGGLTGMDKAETAAKFGEDQVKIWRRSFDVPPPPMEPSNPYYDQIVNDPRYEGCFGEGEMPLFESLELTICRAVPFWNDSIVPEIQSGKNVIIAAHGNSLRALVKHIDNISNDDIMALNLPTGIPFVYEFDANMVPVTSMRFLGDEATVKAAMESVANQGKAK